MAQVEEYLPSKWGTLNSNPSTTGKKYLECPSAGKTSVSLVNMRKLD
jgi:hypothetical protein